MKTYQRPYFVVQVKGISCIYDLRINDIPVLQGGRNKERTVFEQPVNPLVFSGENQLSLNVQPIDDVKLLPNSIAEIILYVRPAGTDSDQNELISGISFEMSDTESGNGLQQSLNPSDPPMASIEPLDKGFRATRQCYLTTPFPSWIWLGAQVLEPTPPLVRELQNEYHKFHEMIATGNLAMVRQATAAKANEMRLAYYLDSLAIAHQALDYQEHMGDPEVKLLPIIWEDVKLVLYADKRLASFILPNGLSPVVFEDEDFSHYMNVMYCKKGRSWVQIR